MMIGRIDEQRRLREAFESEYSEFVAVYGRRRVGKTFLVREQFNYKFTFQHTGLARKSTREQLQSFQLSLRRQGYQKAPLPGNWIEAFDMQNLIDFREKEAYDTLLFQMLHCLMELSKQGCLDVVVQRKNILLDNL